MQGHFKDKDWYPLFNLLKVGDIVETNELYKKQYGKNDKGKIAVKGSFWVRLENDEFIHVGFLKL